MKKIVVIGLGAVGTVFATFLKNAGHTVYGVIKDNQKENFESRILRVDGIWGDCKVRVDKVFTNIKDIKDDIDLVVVAVKSYDTEEVAKDVAKIVNDKTFTLLTQNGYGNYEKASNYIKKERLLLGRVIFGAKVNHPSYVTVTVNADDVRIGQPENLADECEVMQTICLIKHAGIPASYSKDIYRILWDKIIYNCALNPLGAILEKKYGQLAENQDTVLIMNHIIKEIFEVCRLNKIALNFQYESYIEHFYNRLIPPTVDHYPSMYYDIKAGKRTEIDALNGAIVELGRKVGYIPVVNLAISTIIRSKELSTSS